MEKLTRIQTRTLLATALHEDLVQELIPQLREEGQYRASLTRVCAQRPFDPGL